ncbi:MAG: VPLPA-CTERM sorting domain-containing protein [Alphaproteobacteria bacterium]|nr:VPLPA-CTERM sorting domain-containing protein [Alphaproteobacteria bacterium]HPF45820.1 VPLPA-CTERM sorting domain-containing protein [Emcibacteraceae bacterium]HRW29073.1 VPLPA-CTERM sorting domain-containing protein [Emcibacteraceae bacterium]
MGYVTKLFKCGIAASLAFFFASFSSANAITVADVGLVDTYLGECTQGLPAALANEVACLNTYGAGTDTSSAYQNINADNPFEELSDAPGIYAMDLNPAYKGGYFLLRTGNIGGEHKQYSFVFQNNNEAGYAVINLTLFQAILAEIDDTLDMSGIGKVSHITSIVGISAVPLPAAAWMMITALGGIFGFRNLGIRRRKAA